MSLRVRGALHLGFCRLVEITRGRVVYLRTKSCDTHTPSVETLQARAGSDRVDVSARAPIPAAPVHPSVHAPLPASLWPLPHPSLTPPPTSSSPLGYVLRLDSCHRPPPPPPSSSYVSINGRDRETVSYLLNR